MKNTVLLLLIVEAVCICYTISTQLPGLKIRLTQKGLDYGNTVAKGYLKKKLRSLTIPDVNGKFGTFHYTVSRIKTKELSIPDSKMNFVPSKNGLTWTIKDVSIKLDALWNFQYEIFGLKSNDHGSLKLGVTGVSMDLTIGLGQAKGTPTVSSKGCHVSIDKIEPSFTGGTLATVATILKDTVVNLLKKEIIGPICKEVGNLINKDANKQLQRLKLNTKLDNHFVLDYSLLDPPSVESDKLEFDHKGEIFWEKDTKEAPFSPKTFHDVKENSRMLYLWVSEYVANTFAYSANQHKYTFYTINKDNAPSAVKPVLRTTCSGICIGSLLPDIGLKYPNSVVEAKITSNNPAKLTVTTSNINLNLDSYVELYAQSNYLMTFRVKVSMNVTGSVVNERVTGKIVGNPSTTFEVVKSSFTTPYFLDPSIFNKIMEPVLKIVIIPKFDGFLMKGIGIPVTGALSFHNTGLKLTNGAILISTDVEFQL